MPRRLDDDRPLPSSALALLSWAAAALLGSGLAAGLHQGSLVRLPLDPGAQDLAAVAEVRALILERWVEEPAPAHLLEGALRGMVGTLDPYSDFISPEQLQGFEEETTGKFGGLGIYIEVVEGTIVVIAPIEDTPAWRAGIRPGDRVLRIDGQPYSFASDGEAVAALKGDPGTTVRLSVLHEGEAQPVDLAIERAVIQVQTVKGARLLDATTRIGYLRITTFNSGTAAELTRSAARLNEQGMTALILDLRGNPGGILKAATDIADELLEADEPILFTRERADPDPTPTVARQGRSITVPAVVLLDGGSASASEVLAGALRDHQVAALCGQRSYGKGSVQSIIPVMGGRAELKLTTQYYLTPSLRRIHRGTLPPEDLSWGLLPDLEVDVPPAQRAELARVEAERDMARLRSLANGHGAAPGEERLHHDDPQVRAAYLHLAAVLQGTEPLVPASRRVADVGPIGTATTAAPDSASHGR